MERARQPMFSSVRSRFFVEDETAFSTHSDPWLCWRPSLLQLSVSSSCATANNSARISRQATLGSCRRYLVLPQHRLIALETALTMAALCLRLRAPQSFALVALRMWVLGSRILTLCRLRRPINIHRLFPLMVPSLVLARWWQASCWLAL